MPRDGLRSAVYRSLLACDDPKGVADCNARRVRKSKNQEVSDCIATTRTGQTSRDCYDELREVIRESFARQNLKGMYCGDRKDLDLLPSSGSSVLSGERKPEKPNAGNLIAKLMGLDVALPAEEKISSDQRSRLLDIDLLARPRPRFKGVVDETEGKCQHDPSFLRKMLAAEGRPPIVVMRPRRVPHFHSRNEGSAIKRRQMPRGVREEFPLHVPKRRVMVTETNERFRDERTNNRKINKDKKDPVFRDKLSAKKINHPKPLVPRVHKNEAVAKRIDVSPKLASTTRKQAGSKDAKTRDQGKTTTLKHIRRTTRDSNNVSNSQNATLEKKTKPMLPLSSIPKKNLRKSKPDRKHVVVELENIQNEGSLPIDTESSITRDSMMNPCYVSTSDNSANAIDKNDMKCVEDGTCIHGRSLDDTKGWESMYNTRRFLLSSASFLSLVEELFDVGTCDTGILRTPSSHDSELTDGSLLLDCAMEMLERKSTLRCTRTLIPSSQNLLKSPKRRSSLRQLIGEISDGIEVLTDYNKSCGDAVHADHIYSMLERDLWWNEEVTGAWDLGWRTGNATEDVNRVLHDLEELVLREIIADVVIECMFG